MVTGKGELENMMWALVFMQIYNKERTMRFLVVGMDPKTFRKWVKNFIIAIVDLEIYFASSFDLSICLSLFIF